MKLKVPILGRYEKAVQWFEKTLAHIPSSLNEMWEPTVDNFTAAITYYSCSNYILLIHRAATQKINSVTSL
ncbi:hypothetical protein RHSIM_Rhsim02G0051500 [Rhododendron simsii]|uniref:Uncharacterized protein n=1 Tax=Rhododendron simsii TaxID=118357 RepID=A0A834HE52_RHOSS|nr:hypothetical protein RHSIM_Rhsim02G0051500 [Rhododendron simsii]